MNEPWIPEAVNGGLAALALITACLDGRDEEREAIIRATAVPELILGLVLVAGMLRASLAASTLADPATVDVLVREHLLTRPVAS